jgi:endonuclease/exonuclease/phosphatase family metal-dependent hydrolase
MMPEAARPRLRLAAAALSLLAAGCAAALNHSDPSGPRFAGSFVDAPPPDALRVVTFNVKFGRNVAGAAALLESDPRLRAPDVLAVQELDENGAECLARTLRLNYVYYPAAVHPADRRNFGNAILSPWPIGEDRKLILPHRHRFRGMQRIAVAATVRIRDVPVRVYSVHLETPAGLGGGARRDQARAILEDAASHPRVIVAGDLNGQGVVKDVLVPGGYTWPTRGVGRTISRFSWDHILVRGLRPAPDCLAAGAVANAFDASDHRPVWARLVLE